MEHAHWVMKKMYCKYNDKTGRLHVPIGFADDIQKVLEDYGCEVRNIKLTDYPLRRIRVKMNAGMSDRPWQVKLIEQCSDPTPGIKGLAMQTGKGKTYSATKAWVNLGYAGIVIVEGLTDQWIESITKQTDITTDELYKIEGFNSLAKLAEHPEYKPAIFVASHSTMRIFSQGEKDYDLLPWTYPEFLREYGIGVKIIEKDRSRCEWLSQNLPKAIIINGDGTDQDILMEEGIETCESFVTLTGIDEENIFLSLFAQQCNQSAKVITKTNRISIDTIIDRLNLGSMIHPKNITAESIIRYARAMQNSLGSNVETLYYIVEGKAEALEFAIHNEPSVVNIPLAKLHTKDNVLIACIIRNGKSILPNGQTSIEEGDSVIIVTTHKGFGDIKDILEK